MKKIGRDISAAEWWVGRADSYADTSPYHAHRLSVVTAMIPTLAGKTSLDFGCGSGMLFPSLLDRGSARIIGIEPDPSLARIARDHQDAQITVTDGGLAAFSSVGAAYVDLVLAINVLGYLTDEEDAEFYRSAQRVLKPGGALLVTHSNKLFDLFTLNAFTAEFFTEHFKVDASPLLSKPTEPDRTSFNIRENPLSYRHKLARYGFREERQEYINWHTKLPLLDPTMASRQRLFPKTLDMPEDQRWRLMFQCSMFASLSIKQP